MRIKAISGFTAFDEGQMKVFNEGDEGDVTDALAQDYIDAGKAEKAKAKGGRRAAVMDEAAQSAGKADEGEGGDEAASAPPAD